MLVTARGDESGRFIWTPVLNDVDHVGSILVVDYLLSHFYQILVLSVLFLIGGSANILSSFCGTTLPTFILYDRCSLHLAYSLPAHLAIDAQACMFPAGPQRYTALVH